MLSLNKTVTFENAAMFLNLINNVYLPKEDTALQEQHMFEISESSSRLFGYIDQEGRF